MGIFDIFKKNGTEPAAPKAAAQDVSGYETLKFASMSPLPFDDAEYQSLFINYTGEITLASKDAAVDIQSIANTITIKILTVLTTALSTDSFCYKEFATRNESLKQQVSAALPEYDIKSFCLLSFEPDEMSKERIQSMDEMKKMSDPAYLAQKMQDAMAQAKAQMPDKE